MTRVFVFARALGSKPSGVVNQSLEVLCIDGCRSHWPQAKRTAKVTDVSTSSNRNSFELVNCRAELLINQQASKADDLCDLADPFVETEACLR